MKPLILIYSKDADFFLILCHILEVEGFRAKLVGSSDETFHGATEYDPAGIVLDCRPGCCAHLEVCSRLKNDPQTSGTTTVALISPGAENQVVDLIKLGIDECFVRPIAPIKLLEFLKTSLNCDQKESRGANPDRLSLNYSDIEMDICTRRVRRNGEDIHLGPIEFSILHYLLQNPEQVFSRDELIKAAWPENVHVDLRTVDVHIGRLRRNLMAASNSNIIRTVRAAGYALDEHAG